jgi:hypothetical protein
MKSTDRPDAKPAGTEAATPQHKLVREAKDKQSALRAELNILWADMRTLRWALSGMYPHMQSDLQDDTLALFHTATRMVLSLEAALNLSDDVVAKLVAAAELLKPADPSDPIH